MSNRGRKAGSQRKNYVRWLLEINRKKNGKKKKKTK
jgi:hypothetical protein